MASEYKVKISSITSSAFSCWGISSFSDYVRKRGLTTYNNGAYVDLADLLTQNSLTSTALTNTNGYHSNFKKGSDTVCRGVMKNNLSYCGAKAGWVTLPLYSGTTAVDPVLAGTVPKFNLKATLSSAGTYTLKLASGKLTVNGTTISAEGSKPPLQVLVVMQGGGGGGGGGTSHWLGTGWWTGAGGGSGGAAVAILNLAACPEWTLTVGSGGGGGAGGTAATDGVHSNHGSRGGTTKAASGSYYIECGGGGGGQSFSNVLDAYYGGSGGTVSTSSAGSAFSLLTYTNGVGGKGSGDDKAANTSAFSATYGSTIYSNVSYLQNARTGSSDAGAGAPSVHANGNGGSGAGGNGGSAGLFSNSAGSNGGTGFIKIYY